MPIERDEIDLAVRLRNRIQRTAREQPDSRLTRAQDALDHDVEIARRRGDRGDYVLVGSQRIGEPSLRPVAELVEARRQPLVEDDVQLPGELLSGQAPERGVQILRRRLEVAFAGDPHESQQRPARSVASERIPQRLGLSRRGRRRRRRLCPCGRRRDEEHHRDGEFLLHVDPAQPPRNSLPQKQMDAPRPRRPHAIQGGGPRPAIAAMTVRFPRSDPGHPHDAAGEAR